MTSRIMIGHCAYFNDWRRYTLKELVEYNGKTLLRNIQEGTSSSLDYGARLRLENQLFNKAKSQKSKGGF
ncbi:MAG: hypothetical protein RR278_03940 [Mucinivorans sp.]